jgi:hypothetical protein
MIAGYHLVWTIQSASRVTLAVKTLSKPWKSAARNAKRPCNTHYGWWLPNDPRGSRSHEIRNPMIANLGELHYGRKRLQPVGRVIHSGEDMDRTIAYVRKNLRGEGGQSWPFVKPYDGWLPAKVSVVRRPAAH